MYYIHVHVVRDKLPDLGYNTLSHELVCNIASYFTSGLDIFMS